MVLGGIGWHLVVVLGVFRRFFVVFVGFWCFLAVFRCFFAVPNASCEAQRYPRCLLMLLAGALGDSRGLASDVLK